MYRQENWGSQDNWITFFRLHLKQAIESGLTASKPICSRILHTHPLVLMVFFPKHFLYTRQWKPTFPFSNAENIFSYSSAHTSQCILDRRFFFKVHTNRVFLCFPHVFLCSVLFPSALTKPDFLFPNQRCSNEPRPKLKWFQERRTHIFISRPFRSWMEMSASLQAKLQHLPQKCQENVD